MKHKLFLFVFLIGMTFGEYPGSNLTSSSTTTDLPAGPVLEDDLPLTFKVVTTKTDASAPATTPPPFVAAKQARSLPLVTGRTDIPAASPGSIGNQDEVVPVAARPPAETMRIVTGHWTVTPSPNSRSTTSPEVIHRNNTKPDQPNEVSDLATFRRVYSEFCVVSISSVSNWYSKIEFNRDSRRKCRVGYINNFVIVVAG